MPTRAGWLVLVAALATALTGRLLGAVELYVVAAGMAALVAAAVVAVRLRRLRLEVAREVHPLRVEAGSTSRVEVRATNLGRGRTPMLRLRDPVTHTRGATLTLAPLPTGSSARAAYRLPTSRRGLVHVGPLTVEVSDPLGLATLTALAAGTLDITVYPRTEQVDPPTQVGGRDPHAGAEHPSFLARGHEDFATLRPYVVGDDFRRVHWASSARVDDDLLVRQDEIPWQGRATVLLDNRQAAFDEESFEQAVSAAASLVAACNRRRDLVRLVTTDGVDSGIAAGHAHVEAILEHLAVVELSPNGSMRQALAMLDSSGAGGSLVAVLSRSPATSLASLTRLRRRFGTVRAVVVLRQGDQPPAAAGLDVLALSPGEPLGPRWGQPRRPVATPAPSTAAAGAP